MRTFTFLVLVVGLGVAGSALAMDGERAKGVMPVARVVKNVWHAFHVFVSMGTQRQDELDPVDVQVYNESEEALVAALKSGAFACGRGLRGCCRRLGEDAVTINGLCNPLVEDDDD